MARDLEQAIEVAFRGTNTYTRSCQHWYGDRNILVSTKKYMEIPIKEDLFELPVFALLDFNNLTRDNKDLSTDVITAMLFSLNGEPRYKSLDRYMRDIILEQFTHSRLVKCEVKQGTETILYYGTHGAVFDKHFKPMMMCSWIMERQWLNEETREYKFIKPILRIDPECYIHQWDPMQRWIVKKAASAALSETIYRPYRGSLTTAFEEIPYNSQAELIVEIGKSPFKIRTADIPSISTTNESLLQLAIDHIEEVVA